MFSLASTLLAAPKLRLSTAAVGPISIATGAAGAAQTVEAYNAGDGALALRVAGSATWLVPTLGSSRACTTRTGACTPVQIALQTAALAKGSYTGTVTVLDPNAIDAPQTITVTVQMGGGTPDRLDFFVAPNGTSQSIPFTTSNPVTTTASAPWLSVSLDGAGSFRFSYPYHVVATNLPGQGEGSYTANLTLSGSQFAPDNKVVPATLRVTSQPILSLLPATLRFRVAQGSPKQTQTVVANNSGLGVLAVSSLDTSSPGGTWLLAVQAGNAITVTADAGTLPPGSYEGRVGVASNAANGAVPLPVILDVVASSPPIADFEGVVNNATFEKGSTVAQGAILAVKGEQFTYGAPAPGTTSQLASTLGGTRVLVNGQPAPLYYSSYGQVNFQMPFEAPPGSATVQVERDGQRGNIVSVEVVPRAPRILRFGGDLGEYGIIVNQDGSFPISPVAGLATRPARVGDALTIYAIGLGQTVPAVGSGQPSPGAEPLARVPGAVTVNIGGSLPGSGSIVTPLYAGLTPGFVGLYQINVVIPEDAARGSRVPLVLDLGTALSNRVELAIE